MQKITMTEAGRALLQLQQPHQRLPAISTLTRTSSDQQFHLKRNSRSSMDLIGLRNALKDDQLAQLKKVKQIAQHKAYRFIKEELLKDISNNRQFLQSKADNLAKKIISEGGKKPGCVHVELSKAKNYLNKVVKDFETMQGEDIKLHTTIKNKISIKQ